VEELVITTALSGLVLANYTDSLNLTIWALLGSHQYYQEDSTWNPKDFDDGI
jgi:hypothetical protein